jgi:sodium/hydrogen antiporter
MHLLNIAIASMAGLALVMGLFTYWIRRHWINEPLLALLLGVLLGPHGLRWLDLRAWGDEHTILEVAARLTLAIALVGVGLELRGYLGRHGRSLLILVVGGAALMWAASSLLVIALLGMDPLSALLIGAVVAPIDPILTATVATGRLARETVPERTRHLLTAESSARHGLGLLLVLLPALLLSESPQQAWTQWMTEVFVWKGLVAVAAGAAIGYAVGYAQRWSANHNDADITTGPLVALFLALSLAIVSAVELAGSDGVLAVLVAGGTFAAVRIQEEPDAAWEQQRQQYEELIKQVVQVPVFMLLGAALPWTAWRDLGWMGMALVVAILLLRRIPAILLLKPLVAPIRRWDEALFIGWFGPIGVGALYFAAVAHGETHREQVWVVATLLIASNIVVHDVTATPLSRWLARRHGGQYAEQE